MVCSTRSFRLRAAVLAGVLGLFAGAGAAQAQPAPAASLRQACRSDYRSFCAGTRPGGGRILACLQKNAANLSPACQQALAAARPNPG